MNADVKMMPGLLVDELPPGLYYNDRASEAPMIEDLRDGYVTMGASVPMRQFVPFLKAKLGLFDKEPTWGDWARYRFYIQDLMTDFVFSLCMADFDASAPLSLVRQSVAQERPNVYLLGQDEDAPPMMETVILKEV